MVVIVEKQVVTTAFRAAPFSIQFGHDTLPPILYSQPKVKEVSTRGELLVGKTLLYVDYLNETLFHFHFTSFLSN